jgi:thiamine-phosphate pyrophosphorylase
MRFPGRLYLLFTPEACRHDPWDTLRAALEGGVDLVQWRRKEPDRVGFERCRELCQQRSVPVIVNDDVMLAVRGHASGAHIGQDDMPIEAARKILVGRWLGVSTHSAAQIAAAATAGADYVGFGPCHATATKGYAEGLPRDELEAGLGRAHELGLPLFAIGGITPENLLPLRALGVNRAAVSSFVLRHEDPRAAARALRRML